MRSFVKHWASAPSVVLCVFVVAMFKLIMISICVTGSKDNCPPGGIIAFPSLHAEAGGIGTFSDPISYAGASKATPPGTIIYIYALEKYFMMEDYCWQCVQDWKKSRFVHFDIWIGDVQVPEDRSLIECEVALSDTLARTTDLSRVYVNAPHGLPVDNSTLYDRPTATCAVPLPASTCVDEGMSLLKRLLDLNLHALLQFRKQSVCMRERTGTAAQWRAHEPSP